MKLDHPKLVRSLQLAFSAERAAAFAYFGHAGSLRDREERCKVQEIEKDEWDHRDHVLSIMRQYDIPISNYYEWKFYFIGRMIGFCCYFIGWFMPYFFAGRLESGNVCEYFVMMRYFRELGISEHDEALYEMGIREKEHEMYFLETVKGNRLLPIFETIFRWGEDRSFNDIELSPAPTIDEAKSACGNRD